MKKFFTLVAMATMALAANAQTEVGIVNINNFTWEDCTNDKGDTYKGYKYIAGQVWAQTDHVKWDIAADFEYQTVSMTGENDAFNTITIDNVPYLMEGAVQATGGNGKDVNTDHTGPAQVGGSEQRYTVSATGYLYVFSKTSPNKKYYVYEGDITSAAANTMAYTHFLGKQSDGTTCSYTLPADENGYVAWPAADAEYPTEYFLSNKAYNQPDAMPGCANCGACLGVIAFPVFGTADAPIEYFVFASGSKITTNGFIFVPAESPTLEGLSTPVYSKEATAISNINADVENAKAPVKVVKNGQIMIGDFNIAGQRVK